MSGGGARAGRTIMGVNMFSLWLTFGKFIFNFSVLILLLLREKCIIFNYFLTFSWLDATNF